MWSWLAKLLAMPSAPPLGHESAGGPDAPPVSRATEAVGLEVAGPDFYALIAEGATLPATHVEMFTTAADNQGQIDVPLLARRGRGPWRSLGSFVVREVSPALAGCAQVAVTVRLNPDGSLEVSATDLANGRVSAGTVGRVGVQAQ